LDECIWAGSSEKAQKVATELVESLNGNPLTLTEIGALRSIYSVTLKRSEFRNKVWVNCIISAILFCSNSSIGYVPVDVVFTIEEGQYEETIDKLYRVGEVEDVPSNLLYTVLEYLKTKSVVSRSSDGVWALTPSAKKYYRWSLDRNKQ
jgi:hypothetical protein